jgi:hypothetical protein
MNEIYSKAATVFGEPSFTCYIVGHSSFDMFPERSITNAEGSKEELTWFVVQGGFLAWEPPALTACDGEAPF